MNHDHSVFQPHIKSSFRVVISLIAMIFMVGVVVVPICAQPPSADRTYPPDAASQNQLAKRVEVQNVSSDTDIDRRLSSILEATGWFSEISVKVNEGVVFLDGLTNSAEHQAWAGSMASKTKDVVAVVNRIQTTERSLWDFTPAFNELKTLWDQSQQRLPRLGLGLVTLLLVVIVAKLAAMSIRKVLAVRIQPLLRDVAARILSILIFLVGFYLVLQIAGLSGLAATVLGGTGLIGLVAGIAFRDILENYLASILISLRNPFRIGDVVEIENHTGLVLRVTTRGTVLMNLDGNHVQIPNARVYKSIIRNYTSNPNRREIFEIGIGFENAAEEAQKMAMAVLNRHPAVLKDPKAMVLVDRLGAATVNLRFYYWYDGTAFDCLKVRSSLICQMKQTFEKQGISMPDEAREVLFPDGVPVRMLESTSDVQPSERKPVPRQESQLDEYAKTTATDIDESERDLSSDDDQLREQARKSRVPEEGAGLLEESSLEP